MTQRRLLASVVSAKSIRKSLSKTTAHRERELLERHKKMEEEKLRNGLAGKRLGKHVVPEGEINVQLGEDLSESFRGLKVRSLSHISIRHRNNCLQPEGNLFRDRFLNMQQRALIEPRVPVLCVA